MSYQASEAVRDHSQSKGATRTVAFMLATYAGDNGEEVYPSITTICKLAKVSRKTAVAALCWLVEHGEIERVGKRKRGNVEYSMRPLTDMRLVALGNQSPQETPSGGPGKPELVTSGNPTGVLGKPEAAKKRSSEPEDEAAAAAAPGIHPEEDDDFQQEVQAVFADWLEATDRGPSTRLTSKRRAAIVAALGVYSREEIAEALNAWSLSDWFAGRKARDHKVRNDVCDLLADDDTIEELRDLGRRRARPGRIADPAVAKIIGRGQRDLSRYDTKCRYYRDPRHTAGSANAARSSVSADLHRLQREAEEARAAEGEAGS